jgi:alkanesulfonate monooxygenase SsuD/methylene tetrahydromethanopterin reductase-like flavin-dependent oxidoreductase (luciferase family)
MTYGATWPQVERAGREIDRLGYDLLLMHDHLFATQGDPHQPFFESYTTLGAWAIVTSQVKLGHLTIANPFRNPGVVAKATATLDHISNGRMTLCLGAAWFEEEMRAHGIDTGRGMGERLDWVDEAIAIVRGILDGEEVTHRTAKYQFDHVRHAPTPIQKHMPVIVGASGEKKGLRIVAKHADYWQTGAGPDGAPTFAHKSAVLAEHCAAVGRDPSTIRRLISGKFLLRATDREASAAFEELAGRFAWSPELRAESEAIAWIGTPDRIIERLRPYEEVGIDGLILEVYPPHDQESLERLIWEVKPALGARA